ncbi:hypothetical protein [uncultured Gimesia sp.]|uniref:hypothetical protein n=1 Tax=uncultured Gimesia sp. TaxID=1678688 RepID=UPI0030DA9693|tara:strand:- start:13164 stop:13421 length:258 start_codon:yes stop_codon:yes gene_type:complete
MSAFHHKANLIRREEPNYWFQFFPDFISHESLFGEFCLNIHDGSFEITKTVDHSQAASSVAGLVHKIRKEHKTSNAIPEKVAFVA